MRLDAQPRGSNQFCQTTVMVLMAVADENEIEVGGANAGRFHHADQVPALSEAAGIHQKGIVGHDRIIPGRAQIPVAAVEIPGGKTEYVES